jgi:hypothetical protein
MKSIAFLFAVLVFNSCTLSEGGYPGAKAEKATVAVPDYPADRPALAAWLLVHEENGKRETEELAKDAKSATFVFEKNRCSPVLFYPLNTGSIRYFKPAGCIYPFSNHATWDGGFGAELLFDLLTKPNDGYSSTELRSFCGRFNWARFQTEVADLCAGESVFNPWEMDTEKLKTALTSGKFSKTRLKAAAKPVTVGNTNGDFFQAYVPSAVIAAEPASGEFSFAYRAAAENTVFDGTSVFLVCPPQYPKTTGEVNYRLALLPLPLYNQRE